jgi:hypothetical protein
MARPAIRREEAILDAPETHVSTPAPVAASFRPKRQIEKQKEGRKQKVYSVISGGGIWFKLNQNNITIYDAEKDTVRAIRYCANEPSIYTDEQSINAIREHIVFRDGYIAVAANKPNLQDYLDAHPDNKKNGGNVFFEVDSSRKAEEDLDREFLLHDAISLVRDKAIDELLSVAMYLGINIEQKNQEIRRELLVEAKANPKVFIEMFDNPIVKIRSAVKQAVDFQILRERPDGIYWYDTNRLIIASPAGQEAIDVLSRYCMTEKGAPIYDELINRLEHLA